MSDQEEWLGESAEYWCGFSLDLDLFLAVFPAHAGMDRPSSPPAAGATPFSPRTRGWTGHAPTPALLPPGFPRARGDGPEVSA